MFVKITKSGPRRYVQLVEAYRDDAGRPKQRTVATLGRLDQMGDSIQSMHDGLSRILGVAPLPDAGNGTASFDSSRAFGDLWALTRIWKQLGLDRLRAVLRQRTRHKIDLEALLRIMVLNRLCDADSKLGAVRWLHTVSLPDLDLAAVGHQQLLRTMDAVVEHHTVIDQALVQAVKPLVSDDLSVVFYDMTTIRAEGLSQQTDDIRQFGMSKEGIIARQFMLGLVQTAEGVPLYHEVFEGNTAEVGTLKASLQKVLARFPVRRVIAVADRGLLSIDNLAELQAMRLPNGQVLEFILAVPGRRYGEFAELLEPINQAAAVANAPEIMGEQAWQGLRLVVAHDRRRAAEQTAQRDQKIAALEAQAAQWVGKLDAQDAGVRGMDGKLLLVTNVPDLAPEEIISRYKSLADIERGFKVLKSEIEIGPVYHRLPDRIRAHAMICFIALVLQRVMRLRLRERPVPEAVSPERALAALRRIQTHRVVLADGKPVTGISNIDAEQLAILKSLQVEKPTAAAQFVNL